MKLSLVQHLPRLPSNALTHSVSSLVQVSRKALALRMRWERRSCDKSFNHGFSGSLADIWSELKLDSSCTAKPREGHSKHRLAHHTRTHRRGGGEGNWLRTQNSSHSCSHDADLSINAAGAAMGSAFTSQATE